MIYKLHMLRKIAKESCMHVMNMHGVHAWSEAGTHVDHVKELSLGRRRVSPPGAWAPVAEAEKKWPACIETKNICSTNARTCVCMHEFFLHECACICTATNPAWHCNCWWWRRCRSGTFLSLFHGSLHTCHFCQLLLETMKHVTYRNTCMHVCFGYLPVSSHPKTLVTQLTPFGAGSTHGLMSLWTY